MLAGQPPLFDIKIVSFAGEQQIVPEKFGCIRLTELDEAKYVAWLQASILSNPMTGNMQAQIIETLLDQTRQAVAEHRVVCPPEAPWDEGPSIWSDTWDAVTSAWNSIVNLYNELKSGIVFVLANVVNTFTGSCDKTCQDNLRRGLDFAITYFTGIPPNLPTTGDLIDKGLDYAIDAAVQEAGIPCDEICKSAMKTGLKATAEALKQQNSQPGCFGSGIRYGKTAMCLPDGVKGEPIAGAAHTPAGVLVRVTRTNNVPFKGNTAPQLDYVLKISSVNDISALVGQTYQCPYGFYRGPGVAFQQGYVPLPVTEPAQYALYDRVFLPLLADLKQGTTLDLPVVLKPPKQVNFVYQPFQEAINQSNGKLEGIQGPCSQTLLTSPGYSITVTAELICLNAHIPVACPSGDGVTLTDTKTYTP